MIKVGITGGIGSGKSTVCKLFETLGIPVYYADERARAVIEENRTVIAAVKKLFGKDIYDVKGKLKRHQVAEIVFSDKKILKQYNDIVHPVVIKDSENWIKKHRTSAYTLKEAALLFESGSYRSLDCIITVSAPQNLRIERVMKRDQVKKADVLKRIKNQWTEKQRNEKADIIILNDGKHELIKQVLAIHQLFTSLYEKDLF